MKKVTLYIAQSLDGFVATKDGGVEWLDPFNEGADYGFEDFMNSIDTVVQGNTTYKQFHEGYEGKHSYVFTKDPNKYSVDGITFVKGSPKEFLDALPDERNKNIWLVGGPTLFASFLDEGEVNEMIIFTMPILLGDGIALFEKIDKLPNLKLASSKQHGNGVIESRYVVE